MRIYTLISLGCSKNLVDSEQFKQIIDNAGYQMSDDIEISDLIIINTCGFIDSAKTEAIDTIFKCLDRAKKGSRLVVTGCFVKRYKDELLREIPEIDYIIDLKDFDAFAKILGVKYTKGRHLLTPKHYAYLRISDGCENFCSFCAIPFIRGKLESKDIDTLVKEAKYLASIGTKELIISAQDSCLYGSDLYPSAKLPELLERLSRIESIKWIRVLYLHPDHLNKNIIHTLAQLPKVCNYFEIPFQHASDKILKKMSRKKSQTELQEMIDYIREISPNATIRTTFITGFPGENKTDFEILKKFIVKNKFDKMGVFAYSRQEGTKSYSLPDQIPKNIAQKRANKLMNLQKNISKTNLRRFVGQKLSVILDEPSIGRTTYDAPDIDGVVYLDQPKKTGTILNCKIVDSLDYDLIAKIL